MNVTSIARAYEANNYEKVKAHIKPKKGVGGKDAVALSDTAKDFQLVLKALTQVPDVRQEKINALKSRIENGEYNVSLEDIAAKLLAAI